ncbi:hypothetical protein AMECASPLE_026402 [Ameca splendens]|uniref:Serine-threonine/tyrosine-protein kinase catalytic domain-containing protein n=1 Tax=Ameca splendens TaxID=208324 RepID=A0ABV0XU40_9TELE
MFYNLDGIGMSDCQMDWTLLRKSFQTEVENLSKFRHPNIVDLLGFSEGGGGLMCLIYSYMENQSLEDQLHNVTHSAHLQVCVLATVCWFCFMLQPCTPVSVR